MDGQLLAFFLADAALALLALGVAGVSLAFRRAPPEISALSSQIRSTDSDLSELSDRVQHWIRRDAVRRARAGREDPGGDQPQSEPADRKSALRQRLRVMTGR